MFSGRNAEVSLNAPVRALDAVRADKAETRFLVGTCRTEGSSSPRGGFGEDRGNQLHLLGFRAESNRLGKDAVLEHPTGPVSEIRASPSDPTTLITLSEGSPGATLWKIPAELLESRRGGSYEDEDGEEEAPPEGSLEQRATLATPSVANEPEHALVDVRWRAAGEEDASSPMGDVLTLDRAGNITQWDVAFGAAESTRNTRADTTTTGASWDLPPKMAWDPHNADATAVSSGNRVELVDWRTDTSVPAGTVQSVSCHRYGVTDLDYNPNKPYVLTTAGRDGLVKFWDLRSARRPLMVVRGGHRHWVSRVSYNPFHDQLVVSTGTDSLVHLWRISTISSAPLLTLDDDDHPSGGSGPNIRVSRLEHTDSVYAVAWSSADAWMYATAGYDGRVVLNHVPSKEKYKILL